MNHLSPLLIILPGFRKKEFCFRAKFPVHKRKLHLCVLLTRSDKNFIWMVNWGTNRWIVNVNLIHPSEWHGPALQPLISNELSCLEVCSCTSPSYGKRWKAVAEGNRDCWDPSVNGDRTTSILVKELWHGQSLLWQSQPCRSPKKKNLIKVYFAKHKWLDVNEINRGLRERVIKSNCTLKSNSNKFITNWKKTPKL